MFAFGFQARASRASENVEREQKRRAESGTRNTEEGEVRRDGGMQI